MRPPRLLLPCVVLLAACGQTGPLVLPDQSPAPAVIAPPPADEPAQERRRGADTPAAAAPDTPTP